MIDDDDPYGMKNLSTHDLIRTICGRKEDAEDHQAAKIELKKREMAVQHELNVQLMKKQHELNLQILEKQSKIAKWSIIVGFIGLILGAMIGAGITVLGPTILSKGQSSTPKISAGQPSPTTTESVGTSSLRREDKKGTGPPVTKEKNVSNSYEKPR